MYFIQKIDIKKTLVCVLILSVLFNTSGGAVFASVQGDFEGINDDVKESHNEVTNKCALDFSSCGSYSADKSLGENQAVTGCRWEKIDKYNECLKKYSNDNQSINKEIEDTLDKALKETRIPTAEEETLETPWIDPVDIIFLGSGLARLALTKIVSKLAGKEVAEMASRRMVDVYHYFSDPSGRVTQSILKEGVRASKGLSHTLGYNNRVFVSTISPKRISKANLFAYGNKNATNFVKLRVPASSLRVPAQTFYYGEKGARFISGKSALYTTNSVGQKVLSKQSVVKTGTIKSAGGDTGNLINNLRDLPRATMRYWALLGGLLGLNFYGYSR